MKTTVFALRLVGFAFSWSALRATAAPLRCFDERSGLRGHIDVSEFRHDSRQVEDYSSCKVWAECYAGDPCDCAQYDTKPNYFFTRDVRVDLNLFGSAFKFFTTMDTDARDAYASVPDAAQRFYSRGDHVTSVSLPERPLYLSVSQDLNDAALYRLHGYSAFTREGIDLRCY